MENTVIGVSPKSARRALVSASLFTLAITNAEIEGNSISLFGLSVLVEQAQLIALGRLSVLLAFLPFSAHYLGEVLRWPRGKYQSQDTINNDQLEKINTEFYGDQENDLEFYPDPHLESWELEYREEKQRIATKVARWTTAEKTYRVIRRGIARLIVPLVLGFLAFFYPSFFGAFLDMFRLTHSLDYGSIELN
jgi:hypothetical protein